MQAMRLGDAWEGAEGEVDVCEIGEGVDELGEIGGNGVVDFTEVDGGGLGGPVAGVVGWGGGEGVLKWHAGVLSVLLFCC